MRPGIADASTDELNQAIALQLGAIVNRTTESVADLPEGDWEIMSHDITRIDRYLLVTFLIRHPQNNA